MHSEKLEKFRTERLDEMTISGMQELMEEGELTAEELVLMYRENISLRKDVNAVLELNPDALQIAQALDFERKTKGARSKLHGIPLLVKDNFGTADKMHTTAGSLALENHYATEDADTVRRLREAGAVILGKSNMTEWANFMSQDMPNGYSSRGGQVKNPYGDFDVGGSSSGSAAGTAANLAAGAVGTETSGSVINPAAQNSLVGIKPTVGLASRRGIIPLSHTQDTPGTFGRTVEDAVIILGAMAGHDPKDPITVMAEPFENYDWSLHFKSTGLEGVRIGIPRNLFEQDISREMRALFSDAIRKLEACGAEVKDPIDLEVVQEDLGFAVLLHEFKADLDYYLGKSNPLNPIRSMRDVMSYNSENAGKMLKFGQNLLEKASTLTGELTEREYEEALERNRFLAAERGLRKNMEDAGVDVILLPQDFGCNIGAAAGFPSITVPAAFTEEGEPFGITFTGQSFAEPQLIEYAFAFEQFVRARRKP
ncbi:amidase family protein [Indiicoccus explosivorum]|uniref:amidase family protein n=1 Tax=Indiicoccus explosivorum TaxID=1917864 RepID=UPI000B4391F0|nr:amidase family protein [Indiicoccus explosivorum]